MFYRLNDGRDGRMQSGFMAEWVNACRNGGEGRRRRAERMEEEEKDRNNENNKKEPSV